MNRIVSREEELAIYAREDELREIRKKLAPYFKEFKTNDIVECLDAIEKANERIKNDLKSAAHEAGVTFDEYCKRFEQISLKFAAEKNNPQHSWTPLVKDSNKWRKCSHCLMEQVYNQRYNEPTTRWHHIYSLEYLDSPVICPTKTDNSDQ